MINRSEPHITVTSMLWHKIIFAAWVVLLVLSTASYAQNLVPTHSNNNYQFSGGSGSSSDPWQITTWEDLHNIRNDYKDDFILMNDLTVNMTGYSTYGANWDPIDKFEGDLNGQGFEIQGLIINSNENNTAFIGKLDENAKITSLGIVNAQVTGTGERVAVMVGHAVESQILDSYADGHVHGGSSSWGLGILVGELEESLVQRSFTTGKITGGYWAAGGLVGENYEGQIEDSYSHVLVNPDHHDDGRVGGLVGNIIGDDNYEGTVKRSFSTNKAFVGSEYFGPIGKTNKPLNLFGVYWDKERSSRANDGYANTYEEPTNQLYGLIAGAQMGLLDFSNNGPWSTVSLGNVFADGSVAPTDWYPILETIAAEPQLRLLQNQFLLEIVVPSGSLEMQLPLRGNTDVTVEWGDGTYTTHTANYPQSATNSIIHTYSSPGTYTIAIRGETEQFGDNDQVDVDRRIYSEKISKVFSFGDLGLKSLESAFSGAVNLTQVPSYLPTGVESLSKSFAHASLFNDSNVSGWDVSSVTDMSWMFNNASNFDADLSNWDVSNVTNMRAMFYYANSFNQDISGWNVSKVTDMVNMFEQADQFNADITSWDVSKVTDMTGMFFGADLFNQPVGNWNTEGLQVASYMFAQAGAFDQSLANWDVTKVIAMVDMFAGVELSTTNYENTLIGWGSQNVQNGVIFDGGLSRYNFGQAYQKKEKLINDYGWTITDGGLIVTEIDSWADLRAIDNDLNGAYRLMKDLGPSDPGYETYNDTTSSASIGWAPIAWGTGGFQGLIDGNGYKISGLRIKYQNPQQAAFISKVKHNGTVKDLGIIDYYYKGIGSESGGLIGNLSDGGTVIRSYAKGTMYWDGISNSEYVGGLVGRVGGGNSTVDESFSSGTVQGKKYVGGLIGLHQGNLTNSYSNATVEAESFSGGIIGIINWPYASASNSFSVGLVQTDDGPHGGMVGGVSNNDYSSSSNLYWDIQKSGQTTSNFGSEAGLNTVQMIGDAASNNMTGLDFVNVFEVVKDGVALSDGLVPWDDSYPVLKNIDPTVQYLGYYEPMVLEYNTALAAGTAIDFYFSRASGASFSTIDAVVDWGDGTVEQFVDSDFPLDENLVSNDYSTDGNYTVKLYGAISQFGPFHYPSPFPNADKLTAVKSFGDIQIARLEYSFSSATNLVDVPAVIPQGITSLEGLFRSATQINDPDISLWDVSNVVEMQSVFEEATNFNVDLSNWDVSTATDMEGLFKNAISFDQELSGWNVSMVTNMKAMFKGASSFNQDLSLWNVSNVSNMRGMFNSASSFDQDLSNWNVSNVSSMIGMFANAGLSPTNYSNTLISWAQQNLQSGVNFTAGDSKFYLGSAADARELIISTYNWTITDGGPVLPDLVSFVAPRTVYVKDDFAVAVQLFENGVAYPYTGNIILELASGFGNLSGTVNQSHSSSMTLFDDISYDNSDDFQLRVSINYVYDGNNLSFTSTASNAIESISNFFGGSGSGDDLNELENITLDGRLANIWLGNTNNFNLASNWSLNRNPTSSDYLIIDSLATYPNILTGNSFNLGSLGVLKLNSGGQLEVNGSLTLTDGSTTNTQGNGLVRISSTGRYLNQSSSAPLLEMQRTIQGAAGWRMLSAPVATTLDDLFDQSEPGNKPVTQGYAGSDFPNADSNVLWWDESQGGTTLQGWRQPTASTDSVQVGRGMFHYVFDGAEVAGQSGVFHTDELPVTYKAKGYEQDVYSDKFTFDFLTWTNRNDLGQDSTQGSTYIDRVEADQGWNLVGNPTASTIDWDLPEWDKTGVSNTIYVWDPSANNGDGDYLVWNGSEGALGSGKIAPWQSFWVYVESANPLLAFNKNAKIITESPFVGKLVSQPNQVEEEIDNVESPNALTSKIEETTDLRATAQDKSLKKSQKKENKTQRSTVEFTLVGANRSAKHWLVVSDSARMGLDPWDAYKLRPLGQEWLALYSKAWSESAAAMQINHVPLLNDQIQFYDLMIETQLPESEGSFELAWSSELQHDNMYLVLFDHVTDQMIPLDKSGSIQFDHTWSVPEPKNKIGSLGGLESTKADSLVINPFYQMAKPTVIQADPIGYQVLDVSTIGQKSKIGSVLQSQQKANSGVSMSSFEGNSPHSRFTIAISATPLEEYVPREIELLPNYPNPFNPSTNIQFRLPKRGYVELDVYSVLGQKVATLLRDELDAGTHTTSWNADRLASGVYFLRLRSGETVQTIKMTLIK